ncbi:MAG TPA: nucleotidyltransferase domain-containing protein [Bacteroidota bacterium]|jgi:predicted nucleotidyltransferase|nr:nucleotidyltransferase domain-containing protein [Bacteroidota bacterium]
MKTIDQLKLTPNLRQALSEIREKLLGVYEIEAISVFGSITRGDADEESDVDLLLVTRVPLTRTSRHQITDLVFEINLKYDTNFSTLVVDRASWDSGLFSVLPIREEIIKDAVPL